MKKLFARLALPLVALLLAAKASAFEITVDSIRYYVESNTSTICSVTYPGSNKYSGDVVIPEKVTYNGRTLTVTAIGSNAFQFCDSLTSITIPNHRDLNRILGIRGMHEPDRSGNTKFR